MNHAIEHVIENPNVHDTGHAVDPGVLTGDDAMTPPVDDATAFFDAWLQQVAAAGQPPQVMAHAMIEDGVPPPLAFALAGAAVIRHGPMGLEALLGDERGRQAAVLLRRWGSEAAVAANPAALPAVRGLRDPASIEDNRLLLPDGRSVALLMRCQSPRLALFGNLLSASECEALIALGRERLEPDTVIDIGSDSGGDVLDVQTRNSDGCSLAAADGDVVRVLSQRAMALVGGVAVGHEAVTLSRYLPGQKFEPHFDYFDPALPGYATLAGQTGQRIATLVVYLSEVDQGGGTLFPDAGIDLRPQRGSAAYFAYQRQDGSADPASLHSGAPVLAGEKWIATLWFRGHAAE